MDVLDDLDQAFSRMVSSDKEDNADMWSTEMEEAPTAELTELKEEIAGEQIQTVVALGYLMGFHHQSYLLSSLRGSLVNLQELIQQKQKAAAIEELIDLLTTARGTTRRVLRGGQGPRMQELLEQLAPEPSQELLDEIMNYLNCLAVTPGVTPQTAHDLFRAGLWKPDMILTAPVNEICDVTKLSEEEVTAVKQGLE